MTSSAKVTNGWCAAAALAAWDFWHAQAMAWRRPPRTAGADEAACSRRKTRTLARSPVRSATASSRTRAAQFGAPQAAPRRNGAASWPPFPLMTADAIRQAVAEFSYCLNLCRTLRAETSPRQLRSLYGGSDAGPAHHGFRRRAAGIHQGGVGLSRYPRHRRVADARARDARHPLRDARRRRKSLWRRSPRLGHQFELLDAAANAACAPL